MNIEIIAEKFNEKLEQEKERLAEKSGYGHLPDAPETIVYNVPNSTLYKDPNGTTCIGYWERYAGKLKWDLSYYCPSCGKSMSKKNLTLNGAHVYKPEDQNQWYFVPLCSKCNYPDNTGSMTVDTKLVPVPSECYELKKNSKK